MSGFTKENAFDFFEGNLTPAREQALFESIKSSPQDASAFREAENEWLASHSATEASLRMVERVHLAIDGQKRAKSHKLYRSVAAIAASLALVVSAGFLFFQGEDVSSLSEVVVPAGEKTEVTLPDGTHVWVNSQSTLSYPSVFKKSVREVELKGEAFFEVHANPKHPFVVNTPYGKITVLGTKFNVCSYQGDRSSQTALLEGSLRYELAGKTVMMDPGDLVTFDGSKILISKTDASQYKSWIDGLITYDDILFPMLLDRLSRIYHVDFDIQTTLFDNESIRVAFSEQDSLDEILRAVQALLPIRLTKDGDLITVSNQS